MKNQYCVKCGVELSKDFNFCPACGTKLVKVEISVPAPEVNGIAFISHEALGEKKMTSLSWLVGKEVNGESRKKDGSPASWKGWKATGHIKNSENGILMAMRKRNAFAQVYLNRFSGHIGEFAVVSNHVQAS